MKFTVQLSISGMCLFVAEPGKHVMHVLLLAPDKGPMGAEMKMEHHFPRIYYEPKFGGTSCGSPTLKRLNCIALDNSVLDLSGFAGNGTQLNLDPAIIQIGTGLDPSWLGDAPKEEVAARVTLPLASSIQFCESGAWQLGAAGRPRNAAYRVIWDVNDISVAGGDLKWALAPLRMSTPKAIAPLGPITEGLTVALTVLNVVAAELPTETSHPKPAEPPDHWVAPHFPAYYDLFGTPPQNLIHRRNVVVPSPNHPPALCGASKDRGFEYTCMVGQGGT